MNQVSLDQAVLEEAPLPDSMEKKRSARTAGGTIMQPMSKQPSEKKMLENASSKKLEESNSMQLRDLQSITQDIERKKA